MKKLKIRANYRSLISLLEEAAEATFLASLLFIYLPSVFAFPLAIYFFGFQVIPTFLLCVGAAVFIIWLIIISPLFGCLFRGHRYEREPKSITGFRGDEIKFEGWCSRCGVRLNIWARYDSLEFPAHGDESQARIDDLSITEDVERDARLAIAEAARRGINPPEAAVRVYALYHMIRQVCALRRLGFRRRQDLEQRVSELSFTEVLKEVGVGLDFEASPRSVFQFQLRDGRLFVEAPQHLTFLWKEWGVGLDMIELKVLEALKNKHANQIIALVQLLGRPLPKSDPIILDTVMIGRDETGPWLLRAPPTLWRSSLERQLSWASGLRTPRRRGFIEA